MISSEKNENFEDMVKTSIFLLQSINDSHDKSQINVRTFIQKKHKYKENNGKY